MTLRQKIIVCYVLIPLVGAAVSSPLIVRYCNESQANYLAERLRKNMAPEEVATVMVGYPCDVFGDRLELWEIGATHVVIVVYRRDTTGQLRARTIQSSEACRHFSIWSD